MRIVIDVPECIYRNIMAGDWISDFDNRAVTKIIQNGTVLPKGHGRLIDADELANNFRCYCVGDCDCCANQIRQADDRGKFYYTSTCGYVINAPTIVKRSDD